MGMEALGRGESWLLSPSRVFSCVGEAGTGRKV